MKKYIVRLRAVDREGFNEIKSGLKTVETRAASTRYRDIQKGDTLVIVCGKERMMKWVRRVRHFKSIGSMFKAIPFRSIMPSARTAADAREIYYGYTGYREKIKKFGLVALELGT